MTLRQNRDCYNLMIFHKKMFNFSLFFIYISYICNVVTGKR